MPAPRLSAVVAVLALLAGGGLSACGDDEEAETVTEVVTTEATDTGAAPGPAEAQAVLEGIIDRDINDPAYHGGGFRSDPALSAALLDQIAQIEAANKKEGFPGLDFDPFLCAQQVPVETSFRSAGDVGDRATFVGTLEFGGATEKVIYVMVLEDSEWKLDSTECVDAAQPKGE